MFIGLPACSLANQRKYDSVNTNLQKFTFLVQQIYILFIWPLALFILPEWLFKTKFLWMLFQLFIPDI